MVKPLEPLGARFQPTPMLLEMAQGGTKFYPLELGKRREPRSTTEESQIHENCRRHRLLSARPIGRAHKEKGWFRDVRSDDLAVACVKALDRADGHRPGRDRGRSCWAIRSRRASRGSTRPAPSALMAGLPVDDRRSDGQSPLRQ